MPKMHFRAVFEKPKHRLRQRKRRLWPPASPLGLPHFRDTTQTLNTQLNMASLLRLNAVKATLRQALPISRHHTSMRRLQSLAFPRFNVAKVQPWPLDQIL